MLPLPPCIQRYPDLYAAVEQLFPHKVFSSHRAHQHEHEWLHLLFLITNYTKRYNVAPDSWAMVGYSMGLIAANAIKAAGPNPTRDKVREAMLATKNLPVVIGRGTWSITDPATRIPSFGYAVMKIQDGKFVVDN